MEDECKQAREMSTEDPAVQFSEREVMSAATFVASTLSGTGTENDQLRCRTERVSNVRLNNDMGKTR